MPHALGNRQHAAGNCLHLAFNEVTKVLLYPVDRKLQIVEKSIIEHKFLINFDLNNLSRQIGHLLNTFMIN